MATGSETTAGGTDFLFIDIGCPLFIQCPDIPHRLKSRLIGLAQGAYLIVSTPGSAGTPGIPPGTRQIIVRYIFRGQVLGFKSSVISAIDKPFRLTFLSYPDSIERMNLRREKRIDCNLPATLTFGDRDIEGIVSDLSGSGCRFTAKLDSPRSQGEIAVDSPVNLTFSLPGSQGLLKIDGKIRNADLSAGRADLGIQFVEIDDGIKDKIDVYIDQVSRFI